MKKICYFCTLITLAQMEAEAIKEGNLEKIEQAKKAHEDYKQICLTADEMVIE